MDNGDFYIREYPPNQSFTSGWSQIIPSICSSNSHVFACQHAIACKCGEASRTIKPLPPPTCSVCGQKL